MIPEYAVYSHLCTDLLEHCSLSEHRKDHAYQFMRRCKDGLVERLALSPLLHEVCPEGGAMLDNAGSHHPDYPPEVPVAPLRYSATAFELARLIHGGIYPGKSNELLVRGIVANIPYFGKKSGRSGLITTMDTSFAVKKK